MTQNHQILDYMAKGNSITPIDALNLFGCFRLGVRAFDLKKMGYNIVTKTVSINGKHFASYSLK